MPEDNRSKNDLKIKTCTLTTQDGQTIGTTIYPATQAKGTVIMASALGVPQSYYSRFSVFLMTHGYTVVSFDYRGTAQSPYNGDPDRIQLIDWGRQDLNRVIKEAVNLSSLYSKNTDNIILIGHSIGGQLTGMSSEIHHIKKALFIASSAPYWKRWTGLQKVLMFLNVKIMIPIACFGRKVFPAKAVGFSSMNMPASIAKTWVKWMGTPGYLFDEQHGYDTSRYETLNFPILSLGFSDDHYAPKVNIDKLLSYFPNCDVDNVHIDATKHNGIAHMGYFHDRHKKTLWKDAINWLEKD